MPNVEELLNQISVETTKDRTIELVILKTDLDYAYGERKLWDETSRHSVLALTGGILAATTDSKKDYRDQPTHSQYSNNKLTQHWSFALVEPAGKFSMLHLIMLSKF